MPRSMPVASIRVRVSASGKLMRMVISVPLIADLAVRVCLANANRHRPAFGIHQPLLNQFRFDVRAVHRLRWGSESPGDARCALCFGGAPFKALMERDVTELVYRSATALSHAIHRREISSRALLEQFLERVARLNPAINAVVTLDADRARVRADAADAALAKGVIWGPLHGVPMTVKDTLEVAGVRTTAGAPQYAGHVPTTNAVAIERLVRAGAVIFGKTNTPTLAMDLQSYNPVFGTTSNPWDVKRTPGGSSGGSAAALAAGLTPIEVGSDIGGSIRTPAHFCGVFGHKPSYGIVPQRGHIPGPPGTLSGADIAVIGPLARDADDLRLGLDVLAGPDEAEGISWQLNLAQARQHELGAFRVAAWLDDTASPVDQSVRTVQDAALARLRAAGARIDEQARPAFAFSEALLLYHQLLHAATAAGMPSEQFVKLAETADRSSEVEHGPASLFARATTQRHRDWIITNEKRLRVRRAWAKFFRDYDVLLCPVTQTAAILHDHSEPVTQRRITVNGEQRDYFDQLDWVGMIGVAYLPSTAAPIGRTAAGLPVGMQIVGPYLEDRTTIAFARALQEVLGGFSRPPGY
jgi:amidase